MDSRPLLVTVMFAASAGCATPVGYQTNTMIYGVGKYRFTDFLRIGATLSVTFWLPAMLSIPVFRPLTPLVP